MCLDLLCVRIHLLDSKSERLNRQTYCLPTTFSSQLSLSVSLLLLLSISVSLCPLVKLNYQPKSFYFGSEREPVVFIRITSVLCMAAVIVWCLFQISLCAKLSNTKFCSFSISFLVSNFWGFSGLCLLMLSAFQV